MDIDITPQIKRLAEMTDEIGLIQHCDFEKPIKKSHDPYPYSIDDNSRAIICLSRICDSPNSVLEVSKYIDFVKRSERTDGFFNNYQGIDGVPIEDVYPEFDCFGRVIWSFAEYLKSGFTYKRALIKKMLKERIHLVRELESPYGIALSIFGLYEFLKIDEHATTKKQAKKTLAILAEKLHNTLKESSGEGWEWFSDKMAYCNARLPHALLLAGEVLDKSELLDAARKSIEFFTRVSFKNNPDSFRGKQNSLDKMFYGVGNRGFFPMKDFLEGKTPPDYDQQPVEVACATELFIDATRILNSPRYRELAEKSFNWYRGINRNLATMIDDKTGGVYDALVPMVEWNTEGINKNQGAESIVSYLMASTKIIKRTPRHN